MHRDVSLDSEKVALWQAGAIVLALGPPQTHGSVWRQEVRWGDDQGWVTTMDTAGVYTRPVFPALGSSVAEADLQRYAALPAETAAQCIAEACSKGR